MAGTFVLTPTRVPSGDPELPSAGTLSGEMVQSEDGTASRRSMLDPLLAGARKHERQAVTEPLPHPRGGSHAAPRAFTPHRYGPREIREALLVYAWAPQDGFYYIAGPAAPLTCRARV